MITDDANSLIMKIVYFYIICKYNRTLMIVPVSVTMSAGGDEQMNGKADGYLFIFPISLRFAAYCPLFVCTETADMLADRMDERMSGRAVVRLCTVRW